MDSTHRAELAAAVAELYARFERYPLRSDTEPCGHCHSPEEERVLHGETLRRLSPEQLAGFATDAMLTWGGVDDLKHFVPRIFEIVATQDFGWPDLEVVFSKLRHAEWRSWPAGEIAAVERYLMAKWRAVIAVFPAEPWIDAPGEAPVLHLAAYLWDSAQGLTTGGGFGSAFWSDRRVQQDQVRRWLAERVVLERLNRAFFAASSDETESAISRAISIAEVIARSP